MSNKLIKNNVDKKTNLFKMGKDKKSSDDSTQETLPYVEVSPDGIMKMKDGSYNVSIEFYDMNYDLCHEDDKKDLFKKWCDFYNYFDPSIHLEMTIIKKKVNMKEIEKKIHIPKRNDELDDLRNEYSRMLNNQFKKGNNGQTKIKIFTISLKGENIKTVRPRMEKIKSDVMRNLKNMGVESRSLNGVERLKLLYELLNETSEEEFKFNYDLVAKTDLTSKDFVAPTSFNFSRGQYFKMADTLGAVSFLQILAPELTDKVLKDLIEVQGNLIVSMHIDFMDQATAIKYVKSKLADIDKSKIDEQKRASRGGYDMDLLPPDLTTFEGGAKDLLDDLQNGDERFFLVTVLMLNTEQSRKKLDNNLAEALGVAQMHSCSLKRLDYEQEDGLLSVLPIGYDGIDIKRGLTTSATAIFMPFATMELFDDDKENLYYGINAVSNNMIMCNRKVLNVPNGLILGKPGYGKSFSTKREMENCIFITDDDLLVIDPEGEYGELIKAFKGVEVVISPNQTTYINPMDININYSEGEDPVGLKSDFILSLCDLILGGKEGLTPTETSIIDRAVIEVYKEYFKNPGTDNMPILEDLYEAIKRQPEDEARNLSIALEKYVKGTLSMFNHRTNIDLNNRLICFNLKEIGKQLKDIGMLIVQDQIWNKVTVNRSKKKTSRIYIDEMHLLLRSPATAAFSVEIWKRFRKWGGIPTGITQNVKDFLLSPQIENILENSDFIYMLNQAAGDREILAKKLNISKSQLEYVTNVKPGEGLLFFGDVIIPFKDKFPTDTKLYKVMTTKPKESI